MRVKARRRFQQKVMIFKILTVTTGVFYLVKFAKYTFVYNCRFEKEITTVVKNLSKTNEFAFKTTGS